jgi:enoyl-CoA hydratase/carnithine racemase
MSEGLSVTVADGVADVRLNRPDRMNALDEGLFEALVAAGERLKAERAVRAVVLSGEGRGFCAGLDTALFGKMAAGGTSLSDLLEGPRTPGGANALQQAIMVWRELPVPVIAAVHGVALGGGLQLALAADLRFVAPDARLSVLEIKWGIVPDLGGMALLRGLVRDDVARELTYSGRMVSGEEALRLGLATRLSTDPRAEALAFAAEVAGRSPDAVRAAKRLLNLAEDADAPTILAAESKEQAALIGTPNQREAVMAGLEKRDPRFTDG